MLFKDKWDTPFKLGDGQASLRSFYGEFLLEKIASKHRRSTADQLFLSCRELARYLYLSANSGKDIFFVGDQEMDEVWHDLITETEAYFTLCSRLRPSRIIHHSGITFDDYCEPKQRGEVREEQLSWLVSYQAHFGDLEADTYGKLFFVRSLMKDLNCDLQTLNQIARLTLESHLRSTDEKNTFFETLEKFKTHSEEIASDPHLCTSVVKNLQRASDLIESGVFLPSLEQLDKTFELCASAGFLYWQHCAAIERLESAKSWQERHPILWEQLKTGREMIGLSTTHLAHETFQPITATLDGDEYTLNGKLPWMSGFGLYNHFVLGFKHDGTNLFAVAPVPAADYLLRPSDTLKATRIHLDILNGTSSVSLMLKNFKVPVQSLVRLRNEPQGPRPLSRYLCPEIGIAYSALAELRHIQRKTTSDPTTSTTCDRLLRQIEEQLLKFKTDRQLYLENQIQGSDKELELELARDNIVSLAISSLSLLSKGAALTTPSKLVRLLGEQLLMKVRHNDKDYIDAQVSRLLS